MPEDTTRHENAQDGPSRWAVRFAGITIGAAIALCASQVLFARLTHRPTLLLALPASMGLLLAASRFLRPAKRLMIALTLLPAMVLVYGFEAYFVRCRPCPASAAIRKGNAFDPRSLWEVIRERRAAGIDAHPPFEPTSLLVLDISKGLAPGELSRSRVSETWGVEIDGQRVLPLGGVSRRHTVLCNEGGTRAEYESDEYGFNNPRGLWGRETFDVAILGDSFMQGSCVGPDANAAHWIRQRFPATVNIGMSGNGPLSELAGLEEYLAPRKPKIVLWSYFKNDLDDLSLEGRAPVLRKYLEEDGFSQRLAERQPQIDAALIDLSSKIEALAPEWPSWLQSIGLTRKSSPIWLGDVVMNESSSSVTALMRLDRLAFAFQSLAVLAIDHTEPDFPLFKRVLARAKSRVESWGGKLVFVYVADMSYLRYKGALEHENRARVLQTAREVGLPIIDTQPAFLGVDDPLEVIAYLGSHCNEAGYKLLAGTILGALNEGVARQ